ncbi:MAG: galactose-1-phosphate uridylyltransferase [Chloroflexi bacterium]|nr:galactose-1-phosphate uridylyltransferase [Chloroflexota bacterium]
MALERHELRHWDGRRLFVYGELRGSLASEGHADEGGATGEPASEGGRDLHQRLDRLTGDWIAISPARNVRPHLPDESSPGPGPSADGGAACPFCPGGAEVPFPYDAAVFENRFPSFVEAPPLVATDPRVSPSQGRCEVVLYTSRHDASLGTLQPEELARLLAIWRDRSAALWADDRHRCVMVFENRGALVGATIAHPHGQVYAFDRLPPRIAARATALEAGRAATGRCATCDVIADDLAEPARRVIDVDGFSVAVPFAAHFPFEVHVRARRHGAGRLADLDAAELRSLGAALRAVALRYDALFGFELPYMMVALEAPAGVPDWHLAFEFLPIHRTAQLLKIRASVETATGLFINDTLPEASAASLRALVVAAAIEVDVPAISEAAAPGRR